MRIKESYIITILVIVNLTVALFTSSQIYVKHDEVKAMKSDVIRQKVEEPKPKKLYKSIGVFELTAYCACEKCCGEWSKYGRTKTGAIPTQGRTIGVDPNVIPLGTTVIIDGHEYVAEDTGNFGGNIIDVFHDSHEEALIFGRQEREVYIYEESNNQ